MAGMLTLAWAVDQSRRVLNPRRRERRVHPSSVNTATYILNPAP